MRTELAACGAERVGSLLGMVALHPGLAFSAAPDRHAEACQSGADLGHVELELLGITLVVGLATSLVQSVTSLQEPTLTFAPKLLALAGAMLLLTPWLLRALSEFTVTFITRMGTMAH